MAGPGLASQCLFLSLPHNPELQHGKIHYNGRYNSGQHTHYNTGGSGKTGEIIIYIILHYNVGRGRETAKEGEL